MDLTKGSAILCRKARFKDFLSLMVGYPVVDAEQAAQVVRDHCGVASRREFNSNSKAGQMYIDLLNQFNAWAGREH